MEEEEYINIKRLVAFVLLILIIGTLKITNVGGVAAYDDEYTESSDIGISAEYSVSGTDIVLQYVATSTGVDATIKYNLRTFA